MHESEAMEFIVSVLRGYMERIYKLPLKENMETYLALGNKIRSYIHDRNGHWVKVKAEGIINSLEDMETAIVNGEYKPDSLEICIEIAIQTSEKNMQAYIDTYKTEKHKSPKYVHDFFPLPLLRKR
ncbi:MAG: hypothetical protein LBG93_09905 [Treponema sp.]|jgi:hypothetical protein|nr:hypothetical protein [Treponema sp.]